MGKKRFEIKAEHLKLLKSFNVDWDDCEFGAPCIDPKRPYGNSSVFQDMIETLGFKTLKEGIYEFELYSRTWLLKGEDKYNLYLEGADEEELLEELQQLHRETETALQICLTTQIFETGLYEADEYSENWEKIINWEGLSG